MAISADILAELQEEIGARAVTAEPIDMAGYATGTRYGQGVAAALVRPASTREVQATVRWAFRHGIRLIPQGANTNLVGSASPDASGTQVILSLERMRQAIDIDADNRSVLVDAGVTLHDLNQRLADHGLWFPIDLGANPTIGGMIATNTGGTRLLRYGDMRANLLGLEAVLADAAGTRLDLLAALRKDNSGVDLKQLLVGTGGAFGVITRAILQVQPLPRQRVAAFVIPGDDTATVTLLRMFEQHFGETLSAFEGMSRNAIECALRHQPGLRSPFGAEAVPDYTLLIELSSTMPASPDCDLEKLLHQVLADAAETGALENAFLGAHEPLWAIRHAISGSLREEGRVIGFDIALPRSAFPEFRARMLSEIARRWPFLKVCDFGHRGDGGDHFNIVWPHDAVTTYDAAIVDALRHHVYDEVVHRHQGSFSAEHGLGPFNQHFYHRYMPQRHRAMSDALRHPFDPRRLLGTLDFAPPEPTILGLADAIE